MESDSQERARLVLQTGAILPCRRVEGFANRLKGLIGTARGAFAGVVLAFEGCGSLHTFGMSYPLDMALVDDGGLVLGSWRAVPPCKIVRAHGATLALEREASPDPWPQAGESVWLIA